MRKRLQELFAREGIKKYASNFTWLLIARIFIAAISFVTASIVIRNLGPIEYGTLTFSLSIAAILSFLSDIGLEKIVSRELILHKDQSGKVLGTAIILRFIGSIVAFLASSAVAVLYVKDPTIKMYVIFANLSLILLPYSIINTFFQARSKSKFPSIVSMAIIVIISIAKIWMIRLNAPLEFFIFISICEPILYALGHLYIYKRYSEEASMTTWKFEWKLAKVLLRESWPLMFASAFSIIFIRIDQIIIQALLGPRNVGLYDAGVRIAEGWYFLPGILTTALFPAVINSMKQGKEVFERRIVHMYRLMYGVSLLIIIPIVILAPWIVQILYGPEYVQTIKIVQIYSWAGLFISVGIVIHQHLIAVGKSKYLLITTCVGATANIILNLFLIPRTGIAGAAYATLISYTLVPLSLLIPKNTRSEALFVLKSIVKYGPKQ